MALTRIKSSNIADETVVAADIADGSITDAKIQTGVSSSKLTGNLPAISGASLTNLTAANVTGALPAIDGSNLTGVSTDTSVLENNIAILAFKTQASNNLAKFNLIDQVIDEYKDGTGATYTTAGQTGTTATDGYLASVISSSVTTSGNYQSTGTHGDYTWYKWTTVTTSGSFTTNVAQDYDYLVVAGGGGGGGWGGGGGGAGGFRTASGFAVAATTISGISVGSGGAGATSGQYGASHTQAAGLNSVFSTITSAGGGKGGNDSSANGTVLNGGSGGGAALNYVGGAGTASPAGQGYAGGNPSSGAPAYNGGGGGGAGGIGGTGSNTTTAGVGGVGENNVMGMNDTDSDAFLTTVAVGHDVAGLRYFAGGGGGGEVHGTAAAVGGSGGGGAGGIGNTGVAGTANTGGGGGAAGATSSGGTSQQGGGAGGSGIVIIRRSTTASSTSATGTAISTANTALSAPTTGDIVMLIENFAGTATLNTDLKAYVSRNGGTGWDQATLVDKGTWGSGTKKIVSANNVAFSNSASGTDMRYKIEWANQASGSKETRVHATSLAWA